MKNISLIIILVTMSFVAISAMAHNKVVVVPLSSKEASTAPAPVAKTGQTTSYGASDDGALRKGINWPSPRFTDNTDGTVTDNLTGLTWLSNTDCFDLQNWDMALNSSNGLASGSCGLSDGSATGDWRLPSRNELESIVDIGYYNPALCNDAGTGQWTEGDSGFTGMTGGFYWSSSSSANDPNLRWNVNMTDGYVYLNMKTLGLKVWPVRD